MSQFQEPGIQKTLLGRGVFHPISLSLTSILVTGPVHHSPQDTWPCRHKLLNWAWYLVTQYPSLLSLH